MQLVCHILTLAEISPFIHCITLTNTMWLPEEKYCSLVVVVVSLEEVNEQCARCLSEEKWFLDISRTMRWPLNSFCGRADQSRGGLWSIRRFLTERHCSLVAVFSGILTIVYVSLGPNRAIQKELRHWKSDHGSTFR